MKAMRIVGIVLTVLTCLLVIFSGLMKFIGGQEVIDTMTKAGVLKYTKILGTAEIVFAILFAYPKTMRLGFVLLSCYFAGAIATELSSGLPFGAVTPIILVWVTTFIRDREFFRQMVNGTK